MKLEVDNISKVYDSESGILDINFTLESGDCIGLIGPNGAGKTTLLRVLATLLIPDTGEILFNNDNIHLSQLSYREIMGYMPEDSAIYKKYSAYSNLEFYSKFYKNVTSKEILRYLDEFDISSQKKVGAYSKGMVRKVLFIKAVFHNPKILILDEPMNAFDPSTRIKIKELLVKQKNKGKIIIISSHILSELQQICDRFLFIKSGRLVLDVFKDRIENNISLEQLYTDTMND